MIHRAHDFRASALPETSNALRAHDDIGLQVHLEQENL